VQRLSSLGSPYSGGMGYNATGTPLTKHFDPDRFILAQDPVFDAVLEELRAGRKRTHWMWFIFPQHKELGRSATARFYGIGSIEEARAYRDHPLLGSRLILCTEIVLNSTAPSLHAFFGSPDDMKFRSCMTLFEAATDGRDLVFGQALSRWCAGERDASTLRLIAPEA
jgi:uncharacterized protein (DUF1810 family)